MPRTYCTIPDDALTEINKRRAAGESWKDIAPDYGSTDVRLRQAVAARLRRLNAGFDPKADTFIDKAAKIIYEGTKDKAPPPWDAALDGMAEAQEFRKQFSISDRHVRCHIDATGPIALSFITDVHLGSPHTDYAAFKSDVSTVLADPRCFVMKGGDWSDKMVPGFKDASAPANQLEPPVIQMVVEDQVMKALEGKIVASCGGNHDRMAEKRTGLSDEYFIHRDKTFPYMPTGGRIDLTVGKTEYRILWTHQYGMGNSRLNPHNIFRHLRQELDPTCDIYTLEHHHDPSLMIREVQDFDKRTVIEIRTGTYKIDDRYSQQFFKEGRLGPQTVVLWPDRKKMVPFHSASAIQDAIDHMNGVQHGTKKGT